MAGADLERPAGARTLAGAGSAPGSNGRRALAGPARSRQAQLGFWPFFGVAIASFGGPLALAALAVPTLLDDAHASAGLAMLAAAVVFAAPLAIWLRYSDHISSSGGLYAFVEAAAGRRIALVQATIWTFSYALYVVYTTVQIVYDLLPAVIPGEARYQTLLALLIPVGLVAVMVAGRSAALLVLGVIAAGQLALAGVLDGVTLAHLPLPASSFGASAPAGDLAKATAQTSLLYVCGSLPLFLGGELTTPVRTTRRGLVGAFAVTALVVTLAVAPLAAAPGLTDTPVPGVSVVGQFAGSGLARAIGIGVAVSIVGVMLCEYLALTRLLSAVVTRRPRPIAVVLGVGFLLAAPLTLIDPDGIYDALVRPSLIALWLSQLLVFAVYPRFAARHGHRALPAWSLTVVASAFALYGLWTTIIQPAS